MNGVHDLGGMDNMGPISIEANEPVFHDDWERYIFGLTIAMMSSGYFQIDEVRRETELMPPVDYLGANYYEKWLFTLENLMVEKDVLTRDEIKAGKSLREEGHKLLPAPKELFERGHGIGLFEALVMTEIDAAWVGDHRDAHLAFGWQTGRHLFEKFDPGLTQRFGVGHDVRLYHRHQVGRIEKFPDPLHMLDRPAAWFAELTI